MKTHPLNVSYLVVGLIFLGLSTSWALRQSGVVDLAEAQWLLPAVLVAAGVTGLAAFAAKNLSSRSSTGEEDPERHHYEEETR